MANLSEEFKNFNRKISLSKTDKEYLQISKEAVLKKIKNHFQNKLGLPLPKFKGQGSFTMGTLIKPLNGSYDIDVGVYLQGYCNYRDDWPTPETISKWIKSAIKGHTSINPKNKSTCVRIIYRPKPGEVVVNYHIDLPVYIEYENLLGFRYTRIGQNGARRWEEKTDPLGFTQWFKDICDLNKTDKSQFKRIVKYLKAWKDYQKSKGYKMPNGMLLTVMAGRVYTPHKRDDVVFLEVLRGIYNKLIWSNYVEKPVEPYNDLGKYLTSRQWEVFHKKLGRLIDDGKKAISTSNLENAFYFWGKHLDNRFLD